MTYIEKLRDSKNKAQVAFQEFALSTGKFSDYLFCFFEGNDNPYYVPRIKQFTTKYHPIKCGGRERVLKVYKLINNRSEYNTYKKAFFIDRDFNEPLRPSTPPIFETPCYSIENLYVSVNTFKEILINEFGLSKVHDQTSFEKCVSIFIERQNEYHEAVTTFNAWYACLIEMRNKTEQQTGVSLKDKLPKGFITFTLQSITATYDMEKIKQSFPNAINVEEGTLNAKIREFQTCDASKVFRGKYEMQFLIKFIHLLLKDAASSKAILKNKINFAFGDASGINNNQAINIFEGYAETPQSLINYLQEVTQ